MRGIDRTVKVQQSCYVPSTSSPRQPRPLSIQSTPSTLSTQSKTRPHRRQAAVISGWPAARQRRCVIATPPGRPPKNAGTVPTFFPRALTCLSLLRFRQRKKPNYFDNYSVFAVFQALSGLGGGGGKTTCLPKVGKFTCKDRFGVVSFAMRSCSPRLPGDCNRPCT